MSRYHPVRSIKICKVCGEGYDAFKARDARGRYCSPACLEEARRRHREGWMSAEDPEPLIGPATLPPAISLGSRKAIVNLGPEPDDGGGERSIP